MAQGDLLRLTLVEKKSGGRCTQWLLRREWEGPGFWSSGATRAVSSWCSCSGRTKTGLKGRDGGALATKSRDGMQSAKTCKVTGLDNPDYAVFNDVPLSSHAMLCREGRVVAGCQRCS